MKTLITSINPLNAAKMAGIITLVAIGVLMLIEINKTGFAI